MKDEEKKIPSYFEKIFTKVKKEELYIFFLSFLSFSFIEVTLIKCPRTLTGPSLRTLLARATLSKTTTTLDYHRGPKVDPRWPVAQQVFLGPIPMSISWAEIRNVFYTKVPRRELLHFYVQSQPVNEVVYGQVVFDKVALANRVLKEGPVKVRGHLINVTSMKEKLKNDKKKM
jgi:hypothetical protein